MMREALPGWAAAMGRLVRYGVRRKEDLAAVLLMFAAPLWLYRDHVLGSGTWIGNADRLNSNLKILLHYVEGIAGSGISAWNDTEMMGYDSFSLPTIFPGPTAWLAAAFGVRHFYVVMGFVSMALLGAAGTAAYVFIRSRVPAGAAALAGALCYEFAALTVLKLNQEVGNFATFIAIPLIVLTTVQIRAGRERRCFAALALLWAALLQLMFLQDVAYVLLLAGALALWRSAVARDWRPLAVSAAALLPAVVFAAPRLVGVAIIMTQYVRREPAIDLSSFEAVYRFQGIRPFELLRWFDGTIFGTGMADAARIGDPLNLTEGFLLSTSSIVPFLIAWGVLRYRRRWLWLPRTAEADAAFFFWTTAATFGVIGIKPLLRLVYLLFLRIDFMHARIIIAGLLPLVSLIAMVLEDLRPAVRWSALRPVQRAATAASGAIVGVLIAVTIERIAAHAGGTVAFTGLPVMRVDALVRVGLSAAAFVLLLAALSISWRASEIRPALHAALCVAIGVQVLAAANVQVNGPATRTLDHPFYHGDMYMARRGEFTPPSAGEAAALRARIDNADYRVLLICRTEIVGGFCAGHIPQFWDIRAIDGYYGVGVPKRLAALPWTAGLGLRTISFINAATVPWPLLGLLNVKHLLHGGDDLFRNVADPRAAILTPADPERIAVTENPAAVTPRAFFAAAAEPASSLQDDIDKLFVNGAPRDVTALSVVEGLHCPCSFPGGGRVALSGEGDRLSASFAASDRARLLVLNELYFPGWHAYVDGREVPILPTNAVMRGVIVPAGATAVTMAYVPFVLSLWGHVLRAVGVLLFLAFLFAWRRSGRRPRAQGMPPAGRGGSQGMGAGRGS